MEGQMATASGNSNDKVIYAFVGLFAGIILTHVYNKKMQAKRLLTAKEDGKESGYIEAHENFEKVLDYAHQNNMTPADVYKIVTEGN